MPFLILDGEDPNEFRRLLAKLTSEHMPCGPDEENAVLTMATCLWRKKRRQWMLAVRITAARFNPRHEAYDHHHGLLAFVQLLDRVALECNMERVLDSVDSHTAEHLNDRCPRHKFKTAKAWIKAIRREVVEVLLPAARQLGVPCADIRILKAAAVLTDEVLKHELESERECDVMFDAALDRLMRLKAAKLRVSLQERSHFHRIRRRRRR